MLQNAMKQQNIDFKEIDKDVLGTDNEFKVPPTGNSWQKYSLMCTFYPITNCFYKNGDIFKCQE